MLEAAPHQGTNSFIMDANAVATRPARRAPHEGNEGGSNVNPQGDSVLDVDWDHWSDGDCNPGFDHAAKEGVHSPQGDWIDVDMKTEHDDCLVPVSPCEYTPGHDPRSPNIIDAGNGCCIVDAQHEDEMQTPRCPANSAALENRALAENVLKAPTFSQKDTVVVDLRLSDAQPYTIAVQLRVVSAPTSHEPSSACARQSCPAHNSSSERTAVKGTCNPVEWIEALNLSKERSNDPGSCQDTEAVAGQEVQVVPPNDTIVCKEEKKSDSFSSAATNALSQIAWNKPFQVKVCFSLRSPGCIGSSRETLS